MDLVISPTLNEAENIDALIDSVMAAGEFHLLVVDDNSSDGTWRLVASRAMCESRLHLLRRTADPGFRNSHVDGFRWAIEKDYRFLFTMDADLSHRAEYLPDLLAVLVAGADVAVGSRYVHGGGIVNWSPWRRLLSRTANHFAKLVSGLPVRDCTAGFVGFRAGLLRSLDLESLGCNGYGFLVELKHLCWRAGAVIVEVPITFHERERGLTKFNAGMIREASAACFRLRKMRPGRR